MAVAKVIINGTTRIDLTNDTVSANTLLSGYKATGANGLPVQGAIASRSAANVTTSGASVTVPSGYYPSNILINLPSGNVNFSKVDMTVVPSISINSSGLITATNQAFQNATPIVSTGYITNASSVEINIDGVNTYQLSTQSQAIYDASTVDQVIPSGVYLTGNQIIHGDANLRAENIAKNVSLFGVIGTHEGETTTVQAITITSNGYYAASSDIAYNPVTISINSIASQMMQRTLSGSYIFDGITTIGRYAFACDTKSKTLAFPDCAGIDDYAFYNTTVQYADFPSCSYVGDYAFATTSTISVNLPLCKYVGAYAFSGSGIKNISLPVCEYFGCYAFNHISNTTLNIPMCKYIESGCFSDAGKLTSISLPICSYIGSYAFYRCYKLSTIELPSCISIMGHAFAGCSGLTYVSSPICEYIGDYAFTSTNAESMFFSSCYFPKCKSIGSHAFSHLSSLATIDFPECEAIGGFAFYACHALSSVSLPKCKNLSSFCFGACYALTSVYLPERVTLGASVFNACSSLSSISLNCDRLAGSTFSGCINLRTVVMFDCSAIDIYAFYQCSMLTSVYLIASSVAQLNTYAFTSTPIVSSDVAGYFGSIYVKESLYDAYISAQGWSSISDRIVSLTDSQIIGLGFST